MLPAFGGVLVAGIMVLRYIETRDLEEAMDTSANGLFGVLLAIWATLFFESWKRKQATIQYIWHCSDSSFSHQDERAEDFKYYSAYNHVTNKIDKRGQKGNKARLRTYYCL